MTTIIHNHKLLLSKVRRKFFANGIVYALKTSDGYLIETTDTFLPFYTKDAIGRNQNTLKDYSLGSRDERWMIGVSVMSGCPVQCKFCATGSMKKWRKLSADEIVAQVDFALSQRAERFTDAREHKINYTRMGEPFLNLPNVRWAIDQISQRFPRTHHYVSTIGIQGADFSWISGDITLQISLHSLNDEKRDWLIPYKNKMSIQQLGQVRTQSNLKTTLNMTLVNESDFDISALKANFDPDKFFVKLSPINPNAVSSKNNLGNGFIEAVNLT